MIIESNPKRELVKNICSLNIILNILTICFGISYIIIPKYSLLYDIFGIILVSSWFLNIHLLYLCNRYLDKTNPTGKKINQFTYFFIFFFIIVIFLMMIALLLLTVINTGEVFQIGMLMYYTNLSIMLFGTALLGINLAWSAFKNIETRGVWNFE